MGFSGHEYWSGLPCPPPRDPPGLGIEPVSLMSPELADGFLPLAPPGKPTKYTLNSSTSLMCVHTSSVVSNFLKACGLQPARLLHPWDSAGKNTGVGCHALLQGIFLTQRLNLFLLCLLHWLYSFYKQDKECNLAALKYDWFFILISILPNI